MHQIDMAERFNSCGNIANRVELALRKLGGARGHRRCLNNSPAQRCPNGRSHSKKMESAAAAKVEDPEGSFRDLGRRDPDCEDGIDRLFGSKLMDVDGEPGLVCNDIRDLGSVVAGTARGRRGRKVWKHVRDNRQCRPLQFAKIASGDAAPMRQRDGFTIAANAQAVCIVWRNAGSCEILDRHAAGKVR